MEACGWVDVIESTLCEDTALAEPLARAGWEYRFVPVLTAVDRDDDISFGPLTRWIARQLLTARLHHPAWPLVALHGISTSLALAGASVGVVAALATGRQNDAISLGGAIAAYEATNVVLFLVIAETIRAALAAMGRPVRAMSPGRTLWWTMMLPATQCVYAMAMARAAGTRSIEWRGIVYSVTACSHGSGVSIIDRSEHVSEPHPVT